MREEAKLTWSVRLNGWFVAGNSYAVTFEAYSPDGDSYAITVNVKCRW